MFAVPFFLESLARHTEIDDGEQREDERLDCADEEDVERLPDDETNLSQRSEYDAKRGRQPTAWHQPGEEGDERPDEIHHQRAGKDVPEEPEGQGDRLDDFFHDVEWNKQDPYRQRHLKRPREAPKATAHAQHPQAVSLDHDDD